MCVRACVITTATSIKVPCISQSRSPPPASSSCLGESFLEGPLRGVNFPDGRKSPLETLLAAGHMPSPPPTRAPPGGDDRALRFRVPGTGAPPSTRWARPAVPARAPATGSAALHRGPWRGWAGDTASTMVSAGSSGGRYRPAGDLSPVGGWGSGPGSRVLCRGGQKCSVPFTPKAPHCPGKAWEVRRQMTHLRIKDNLRAAWALISKSRDAFQRLLEKSW